MMSKSTKKSNDTIVETFKDIIPLSFGEEIGNAASHGVAALLTLLVLPYAAVHSYIAHDPCVCEYVYLCYFYLYDVYFIYYLSFYAK